VGARLTAAVAAVVAVSGCSGAGESREQTAPPASGSTAAETTAAPEPVAIAQELEALIAPATLAKPRHRYANFAELRWIGAWTKWSREMELISDRLGVMFDDYYEDPVAPRRFVERFGRCSDDVAAFGPIPSTRLREVVRATAQACENYEIAAEKLEQAGRKGELPDEAYDAYDHIVEADIALERTIAGLRRDIIPLPFVDRPARRTRVQIRYSFVTSRLEGKQILIRCYNRQDWRRELGLSGAGRPTRIAGFVEFHSVSGNLAPDICRRLDELTYGKSRPTDLRGQAELAAAVATLAHEAQHAVGIRIEWRAECFGMQRIRAIARALGTSPEYASGLAEIYSQYLHPTLPPRYRNDRCAPGTKLDLHPGSPAWP
jgi:hypothetical protein